MTDNWKQRLLPASFRGAAFHVDVSTQSSGRRTVLHEFAKRDEPYSEDMGRRARRFTIAAYVIGDDYFDLRDALMLAMETDGSGTLVHPYLGQRQVNPDTYNVVERRERGRMAEFELSFFEAGSADATTPVADTTSAVAAAAQQVSAANASNLNVQTAKFGFAAGPA